MKNNGYNPLRWDCERDGCFNKKCRPKIEVFSDCFPGRINFGDVDGIVEINGFFLLLEWKRFAGSLPVGQQILYEQLTLLSPRIRVVTIVGDPETMTVQKIAVVANGKLCTTEAIDLKTLKRRVRQWGSRARAYTKKRRMS